MVKQLMFHEGIADFSIDINGIFNEVKGPADVKASAGVKG